jgi:hypothetical protein
MTLLIDDFFSEVHNIMKDSHMREIARIRNEHSVEIMKLRKSLESRITSPSTSNKYKSKENIMAYKSNEKFIENEVER